MVYTLEQLRERITPIAVKYGLPAVYVFGSYAKGEATEESDIDILIDKTGTQIKGMLAMGGLYDELREAIGKPIDLLTTGALEQKCTIERTPWLVENLIQERIKIYG